MGERLVEGAVAEIDVLVTTSRTQGSIAAGSAVLTVRRPAGYQEGDTVVVDGAGTLGDDLTAIILVIAGHQLTLSEPAETTVRLGEVGRPVDRTVSVTVQAPDKTTDDYTDAELDHVGVGRWTLGHKVDGHGRHHGLVTADGIVDEDDGVGRFTIPVDRTGV